MNYTIRLVTRGVVIGTYPGPIPKEEHGIFFNDVMYKIHTITHMVEYAGDDDTGTPTGTLSFIEVAVS